MGKKLSPSGYITINLGDLEFVENICNISVLPETEDIKVLKEYFAEIKNNIVENKLIKFPKPLLLSFNDVSQLYSVNGFATFMKWDDNTIRFKLFLSSGESYTLSDDTSQLELIYESV